MSDREAFEHWYADHTGDAHIRLYCESLGRYQFNAMQSAWEAWQAAQQDQSQPSELEMHRADYNAIKKAGFESPGELLAAWQAAKAEQQAGEPVGYVYHTPCGAREVSWFGVNDIEDDALLYTHPAPAQQEPAGTVFDVTLDASQRSKIAYIDVAAGVDIKIGDKVYLQPVPAQPQVPEHPAAASAVGVVANNNLSGSYVLLQHPPHTTIPVGTVMVPCSHPDVAYDCCVFCGVSIIPDRPKFEWMTEQITQPAQQQVPDDSFRKGRQRLFELLDQEHGISAFESELADIEHCVLSYAQQVPEGYVLVPKKATRKIEDAIGRSRNLSASEIWEDAITASQEQAAAGSE